MAAIVFALTNADGFLLLTFFFGHRPRNRSRIAAGQVAAFAAIVGCGLCGRLVAPFLSRPHIGWLGLVPIGLGLHQWWAARGRQRRIGDPAGVSAWRVAAVLFASGADNIAVYVPLFAASSSRQLLVILATFGALLAVWCALADLLGRRRGFETSVRRFGPRLSGAVLVGLGGYLLWSTGAVHF
jgi:cadmium resistance protein CadD (predicted permease)